MKLAIHLRFLPVYLRSMTGYLRSMTIHLRCLTIYLRSMTEPHPKKRTGRKDWEAQINRSEGSRQLHIKPPGP
jgi:hypothetical protein